MEEPLAELHRVFAYGWMRILQPGDCDFRCEQAEGAQGVDRLQADFWFRADAPQLAQRLRR